MIKEIIKDKLREKQWTFGEIADVSKTVNELTEYAYDKMNPKDKLELVWGSDVYLLIGDEIIDMAFGAVFQKLVKTELQEQIAIIIKEELSDATVIFKENKNEISKRSVGGKPHKKRPTDEASDSKE